MAIQIWYDVYTRSGFRYDFAQCTKAPKCSLSGFVCLFLCVVVVVIVF